MTDVNAPIDQAHFSNTAQQQPRDEASSRDDALDGDWLNRADKLGSQIAAGLSR